MICCITLDLRLPVETYEDALRNGLRQLAWNASSMPNCCCFQNVSIYWLYSSIHMAAVTPLSVDQFQPHQCLTDSRHEEAVCSHPPPRSILTPPLNPSPEMGSLSNKMCSL